MMFLNISDFIIKIDYLKYKHNKKTCDTHKKFFLKEFRSFQTFSKNKRVDLTLKVDPKNCRIIKTKSILFYPLLIKKRNYYRIFTSLNMNLFYYAFEEMVQDLFDKNKDIILHCSAIEHNNQVSLFLGKSGAGKSTLVKLLKLHLRPISDDIALIRKLGDNFFLYQSPAREKNDYPITRRKYSIKNIFLIEKAKKNMIRKISVPNKFLNQQLSNSIRNRVFKNTLTAFVEKHSNCFYSFAFNNQASVAHYFMNFIATSKND